MSISLVCDYLNVKFEEGYNSSTLNIMRSSINFFTLSSLDLENNVCIKRLFKYFFNARPIKARYQTYWPVSKLLDLLTTWYPIDSISLKFLTLKVIALIALTSSDRGQTLHLASTKDMIVSDDKIEFIVRDKIKTTKKVLKPTVITCVSSHIEQLNVAAHVKAYLERTATFREPNSPLFLSWATHKPVTRQSLARWLTLVLKMAHIDTSIFKAHSYRGAGLSKALSKGASIKQIIESGNWSNATNFHRFYNAPSYDTPIGNLILEQ